MITDKEIKLTRDCLGLALAKGASKARATLSRSVEDMVSVLDGKVDKVTHCEDFSISFALFVDGRYGSFSTNALEADALDDFLTKAVSTVRMLSKDEFRDLPDPQRCCRTAVTGDELEIYDPSYPAVTTDLRRRIALDAAVTLKHADDKEFRLLSEEGEYSDSIYECYVADTQGLSCLHRETCFDYGVEITVESPDGEKYSSYWWESAEKLKNLDLSRCGETALRRAVGKIGAKPAGSGRYNMVVESDVASKMISPVLKALSGYAIQQHNSFLNGSRGKQILPEGLTVVDLPHIKGSCCSKLFDSEGVATREMTIIDRGTVKEYFINTYMAAKLSMDPTVEEPVRPKILAWPDAGTTRDDLMRRCGDGILVTDFNGGNCNGATGDFSYGVEGFLFKDGQVVRPVSEMLITGNFIELWKNLIATADDSRRCMSKLIPTLAFSNVDFSG